MANACLHERSLPLRDPLQTAVGRVTLRRVTVLVLQDGSGQTGYGEAAPLPAFGGEDPVTCNEALRGVLGDLPAMVERWLARDWPEATLGPLERRLVATPCARTCVEGALLDLWAKRHGRPLADVLLPSDQTTPLLRSLPVGTLVPNLRGKSLGEVASNLVGQGWRSLKVKVDGDVDLALERLRTIREWTGGRIALRVDANGAWDADRAKSFVVRSRDLGLEFIEQPLPAGDLDGLAALRRQAICPIAVDESVRAAADVGRIAGKQAADIVILKPMVLGGWRPTAQAARLAQSMGLEVVITTFLDGAIGRALASHMACALGCAGRAQGLATGDLLTHDLTDRPLTARDGMIAFGDEPGLGIGDLLPEVI